MILDTTMRPLPIVLTIFFLATSAVTQSQSAERPNILWISCEDIGPHLGCYGEVDAITPALDLLAAQGVRYLHAYTTTPVCATNRSSIITGLYPTTIGTHYMRCESRLPANVRCFTEYLRDAGYYCTNNSKEDYNFVPPESAWDESSPQAHWRGRQPGQPFFAVFNFTLSHESKVWPRGDVHRRLSKDVAPDEFRDPSKLALPPYYPDTAEVRRDWANYHENITQIDHQARHILDQLSNDGLEEDTIIFFWSDHGAGLPRAKRWLYDSGTHVPLIVRVPEKYRIAGQAVPNSVSHDLVSFVDLAPTVLNLASVSIPSYMQGQAFLGERLPAPHKYAISVRDRMDNRYDMIRSVRDKRYLYIRNYMPWKPYAQHMSFAEVNQTMKALRRAATIGTLPPAARLFMADRKPVEELYDCKNDPHNIHNLAQSTNPQHQQEVQRMRYALLEWEVESHDLGLIPEPILRKREAKYGDCLSILDDPAAVEALEEVRRLIAVDVAHLERIDRCGAALTSGDPVVRYWAINVLTHLPDFDAGGAALNREELLPLMRPLLDDKSPLVRLTAADALYRSGRPNESLPILLKGLADNSRWVRLFAVNYISELAPNDRPVIEALEDIHESVSDAYIEWTAEHALHRIDGREISNRWESN